jgi:ligand-binding sensor domain-containing protein
MENNIRVMTVVCRAAFIWLASLALSGPSQAREDTNTHTQASSDEFYVRGWGGDNGLAAGNIISLARTRDGFLWLATDVGLTCFDGLKFQILDRNQFPTVDRDQVSCLLVDRQGVLWAGTGQGYLFRREGAGFREVSIGTVIDRSGISSLAEGNDGSLWVATRRTGVWFLRQGQWQMVPSSSELNARPTAQVVPDKNGQIWVVSSTSLMLYDPKQNRLSKVDAFTNQPVLKIAAGQDGSLWAATMATPGRGTRSGFNVGHAQYFIRGQHRPIMAGNCWQRHLFSLPEWNVAKSFAPGTLGGSTGQRYLSGSGRHALVWLAGRSTLSGS